ncbi:MAG: YggS family pyridoxal phosphate-dependent enzyme [Coriobacteriales bacterium]|jgi:pyridoxal phosphate enzyme (YggS family)
MEVTNPAPVNGDGRIAAHIAAARDDIASALAESTDPARDVLLIAVSKTVGLEEVAEAIAAGVHDFGENRTAELKRKQEAYPEENWHFIGRIQTNKLKDVVGRACLIHSVASLHALDAIEKQAAKLDIVQPVLLEVNVSGEESKDGFAPAELDGALEHASGLSHVRVDGLMTMAPLGDTETARTVFENLREMRDKRAARFKVCNNIGLNELSMGMTQDFREAVREGATMVRLGRSIFA